MIFFSIFFKILYINRQHKRIRPIFSLFLKGISCIYPERRHISSLSSFDTTENTCCSPVAYFKSRGFSQRKTRRNMTIEIVYKPPARRWVPADSIISTSSDLHPIRKESSTQNRSIGVNCTIGKLLFLLCRPECNFDKRVDLNHHQSLSNNF